MKQHRQGRIGRSGCFPRAVENTGAKVMDFNSVEVVLIVALSPTRRVARATSRADNTAAVSAMPSYCRPLTREYILAECSDAAFASTDASSKTDET